MKKTFLRLVLVCLVMLWFLSIYKIYGFICETSNILEKHKREIVVLRLELDFQKSKLEDANIILEEVLNK